MTEGPANRTEADRHSDPSKTQSTTGPTAAELLTVCHLVQDVSHGGVESLLADLASETNDEIDHHVCYLSDRDDGAADLRDAGATVTQLDVPFDSPRGAFDPRSYPPLVDYLRRHEVDVVHTHYPLYVHLLGRIAAPLAGVARIVGSYHNPRTDFHPVMKAAELGTRSLTDAAVGVSGRVEETFEDTLARALPGHAPDGPVYNGVPVDEFASTVADADGAAVREAHDIDRDDLVFVSVGRYDRQKRQTDLVHAMAHVVDQRPDSHLLLVGHGPLENRLREAVTAEELTDHVSITGRVDAVEAYYAAGDVFVSASAYEGFGIVFVEAMAARLPVVGTAVPGTSEVVEDGETGQLVEASDPERLADAMLEFTDAARRTRFGQRGHERAASAFDIEATAEQYTRLYRGQD